MALTQQELDEHNARLDELIERAKETDARIEKHMQEVAEVLEYAERVRLRLLAHAR
jgi:hypothetical protein